MNFHHICLKIKDDGNDYGIYWREKVSRNYSNREVIHFKKNVYADTFIILHTMPV